MKLKFVKVEEDSRCPKDAVCITEGRVVVLLDFNGDRIFLGKGFNGSGDQEIFDKKTVDGYEIKLLDVSPYPVLGSATEPADYQVSLLVKKI